MSNIARIVFAVTTLTYCLASVESRAGESSADVVKFLPDNIVDNDVLDEFIAKRPIKDYRVVEIDVDALRTIIRQAHESIQSSTKPTISLPLLDGTAVSIELLQAEEHHESWQSGIASFIGRVVGSEPSSVVCIVGPDGSLSLTMSLPRDRYKIEKTTLLPYHIYWTMHPESGAPADY